MTITETKIEWTDFTVNFWEGCQKVGPGCDHCYAEARDVRFTGGTHWGPGAPRRKVKGGIAKLRKINRDAPAFHAEHGRWPRVFCSSLSDVFDNAVDHAWRKEALNMIRVCHKVRVQLLTKRIGNVEKMVADWATCDWPSNVGLMITVVNQAEADRDIPKLLDLKARLGIPWVGLSMEPLLEPPYLWKHNMPDAAREMGIDPSQSYADGFEHDNCGGFCVKAGHAHFARLLHKRRETYLMHEAEEQAFRDCTGKDVSVLRDRRGGTTKPMTLKEFRERLEAGFLYDEDDVGGCNCFSPPEMEIAND